MCVCVCVHVCARACVRVRLCLHGQCLQVAVTVVMPGMCGHRYLQIPCITSNISTLQIALLLLSFRVPMTTVMITSPKRISSKMPHFKICLPNQN